MNVIRWNRPQLQSWPTFGRLAEFRSELDRLFNSPLTEWALPSQLLSGWSPALDVYEDKDNFTVKLEVAGMKKEDIEISLHDHTLSISGERKGDEKRANGEAHRTERFTGRFQRSVTLPVAVANDKVKAQYKDGVLTVTLPKTEEAKPKQISVQAG